MADQNQLVVIVKDSNGNLTAGAAVSLAPGGAKGTTNAQGEATLPLGTESKYDVTVKANGDTQTVPFYVTKDGSRRLEVNIKYLKQLTTTTVAPKKSSDDSGPNLLVTSALILAAVLVVALCVYLFKKRKSD